MNVHIYKGAAGKSRVFEIMVKQFNMLGIVYYEPDRPYPRNVGNVYLVPRTLVKEDELIEDYMIDIIANNVDMFDREAVIYTNSTEKENNTLITKLKEHPFLNTIVVMCKED